MIVLLLLLLLIVTTVVGDLEFAVVGYLPEWRYEGANYDTLSRHLTHLLLFSLEPTNTGGIAALDRIPGDDVMEEIKVSAKKFGTKILICFGGNGRSGGFSSMVRSKKARGLFVESLVLLCEQHGFAGVDYNWEYPGYAFGRGYQSDKEVDAEYRGLARLIEETRVAFQRSGQAELDTITIAYYPDTRQEVFLRNYGIADDVDLMHSMSYDQSGEHHSSFSFGKKTADQARDAGLPLHKITMGLPFYGRYVRGGDWVTYEDIVQKHVPLQSHLDEVSDERGRLVFNGKDTIKEKALYAKQVGLGGVMIWEAGQDCRVEAVTRHGKTHVVTCPAGPESSLLVAITNAIDPTDRSNDKGEL
jgi:GH18 family chitinase